MAALAGLAFVLAWIVAPGVAAEPDAPAPIRFPRHPSLSPDGLRVAFAYQGDIWTAASGGGTASRLTLHEAHDQLPAWSPDGKWIAYSSKREGNYDVWLMPAAGGRPRQLTFHSADDSVNGWSPDGKQVLFASARETTRAPSIYVVDVDSGATRLVAQSDVPLANAAFTPDGKQIACTRGGSWPRKGYRGSANASLMLYPARHAGGPGEGHWLIREPENERWALFTPEGRELYYVSDKTGVANLWRRSTPDGIAVQVTGFQDGNLFYPTLSASGDRIVFERNFSLWSLSTAGGEPVELRLFAPSDERVNSIRRERFTTGAQEARLSPDGKQLAFVVHGEIFVQPANGGEPSRLSETPQREEDLAWSPDGKSLAFSSDRDGDPGIFLVDVKSKETRRLAQTAGTMAHQPRFSPDGKSIAFLRGLNGAELCVVPAGGGETQVLIHDPSIGGVAWSPDSKWIAYHRMKAHSAGSLSDVFIVSAAGGKPVNATRYPVRNGNPTWSPDGKRLFFVSDRTTNRNLWSVRLEDEPEPEEEDGAGPMGDRPPTGKPVVVKLDPEELYTRARAVTRLESGVESYALSPDGRSIVFAMSHLGRTDLWRVPAAGGAPSRLTQSGESGDGVHFSNDGQRVVYLSGGSIRSLPLTGSGPVPLPFAARMDIDTRLELAELFDEAWRKMRDAFYDEKMHGVDWNRVRETYRPVVADLTYKEDFYALFGLVLGELNASHTGLSGPTGAPGGGVPGPTTASLGITLDDSYAGPGVRVEFVVPKGPAARRGLASEEGPAATAAAPPAPGSDPPTPNPTPASPELPMPALAPGDLILEVDGHAVKNTEQFHALLADKAGRRVALRVNREPKPEGARTVTLRPISTAAHRQLEYDRWVKEREALTARESGGRLGYLHLRAMDDANLEKFKRAVFGDMQEKEGLVIDVRFNGGGAIADEILAILQDRIFGLRTVRGDPNRLPAPLQVWTKPTIVLINEASFSNAEAFPWGYKTLRLGKVVGVPTYGAVIGTGGTDLIDGSLLRLPGIGAYTLEGVDLENNGCPPDIYVENSPADLLANRDRQLERAVAELLKQVAPAP